MSTTARPLIGREDELRAITGLLEARDELPGAAVLHGQAGIGKTSIWLAGIDAAVELGYRVLSCRPSEAETRLSYAGLADLLGGVVDDVARKPTVAPNRRTSRPAASWNSPSTRISSSGSTESTKLVQPRRSAKSIASCRRWL